MSALFPGYNYVEAFGLDEDYECDDEVEEEVEYVILDLGTVEPTLVPSSSSYRLIGLDTPTPFLQLSGTMLKGQHVSLLGTELLFTEATDEHADRGKKPLVHVANTEHRIRFREVELKPKQAAADAQAPSGPTAKSSNTARKVERQMDHVMSGSAGPSRRGRGGKKRGPSKGQSSRGTGRARVEEPPVEPHPVYETEVGGSSSAQMDTAEG